MQADSDVETTRAVDSDVDTTRTVDCDVDVAARSRVHIFLARIMHKQFLISYYLTFAS